MSDAPASEGDPLAEGVPLNAAPDLEALSAAVEVAAHKQNAVGRTALQVSTPAALVTIGTWWARRQGMDLDPGAGVDLPAEVASAFTGVVATLLAVAMNRRTSP